MNYYRSTNSSSINYLTKSNPAYYQYPAYLSNNLTKIWNSRENLQKKKIPSMYGNRTKTLESI